MVRLNQYLRAVMLRQHLSKARVRLSSQSFTFWDTHYYDCLRYTTHAVENYCSAVREWEPEIVTPNLKEACLRFNEPHYDFIYRLSRYLSGDFDKPTLDIVHEQNIETTQFAGESPMWFVSIAFWMIEESINQNPTFQKSIGITDKCYMFNVVHQHLINLYLIGILDDSISTCKTLEIEYRESMCLFDGEEQLESTQGRGIGRHSAC